MQRAGIKTDVPERKLVQEVYTQSQALLTSGVIIPLDNTIPQNTEGVEVFSLTITPKDANHILEISANINFAGAGAHGCVALFLNAGADAIACSELQPGTDQGEIDLIYKVVAGSVNARTYKIRAGMNGGTISINGRGGAQTKGGTVVSSMTIREYEV